MCICSVSWNYILPFLKVFFIVRPKRVSFSPIVFLVMFSKLFNIFQGNFQSPASKVILIIRKWNKATMRYWTLDSGLSYVPPYDIRQSVSLVRDAVALCLASPDRTVLIRALAWDIAMLSWALNFILTVTLPTQVNELNDAAEPCCGIVSYPEGTEVELLLVALLRQRVAPAW